LEVVAKLRAPSLTDEISGFHNKIDPERTYSAADLGDESKRRLTDLRRADKDCPSGPDVQREASRVQRLKSIFNCLSSAMC
jgi:hypothetical protein